MGSVTRVAMLRVVLVALVVLAVLVTSFWVGQRRLIYFPDRYPPRPSGLAQEVTLHTYSRRSKALGRPVSVAGSKAFHGDGARVGEVAAADIPPTSHSVPLT